MTKNYHQASLKGRSFKGRSFKGQDLTGADFSNADIRGVNFTNASLIRANFSQAKAGLTPSCFACLLFLCLICTFITGLIIGYISVSPRLIVSILSEEKTLAKQILILITEVTFVSFILILIRQGLSINLAFLIIFQAILTAIVAYQYVDEIGADAVILIFVLATIISGILFGSLIQTIFLSIIRKNQALILFLALAMSGIILGAKMGAKGDSHDVALTLIIACLFSITLLITLSYIGLRAMAGDKKYSLVKAIATNICTALGTNFRGANLTDADFTGAILSNTDFRKASLKRTCWFQVKELPLARVEDTYLEDLSLRELVISKNGEGQCYDYQNLRGLNLKEANLVNASFIGADLSESNLVHANLTGAILAKVKLYGTNLSNACLTRACIEDWAISTDLIYDNISCDEIFMRLITHENKNPCRKPDDWNETFKPGDFADFIFPYIDRLKYYTKANEDPRELAKELKIEMMDLYHYNEFKSSVALIALTKLAKKNIAANLEIFSLRVLGEEKVHLKIAIRGKGNCAELNKEYWRYYREISRFSNQKIQQQIELIEKEHDKFSRLISIFTLPPGDSIINISVGRDLSGVLNLGNISGRLSNVSNHILTSPEDS